MLGLLTRSDMNRTATARRATRNDANDQLNNRIFFRLFQLGNVLQKQAVSELGVTTVQWAVLGALSREKIAVGMQFGELAEYLVVSRQNLDGVLKRLERDQLVERVAGPADRRAKVVRLTPRGRQFWADLLERIYEFYDQAATRFKFDDRVALVHYLNQLQAELVEVKLPRQAADGRSNV